MTLDNKRWTRQPYSSIYANKGATYFEKEFMENAMQRWTEIARLKGIETKPYDGKGDHILITVIEELKDIQQKRKMQQNML